MQKYRFFVVVVSKESPQVTKAVFNIFFLDYHLHINYTPHDELSISVIRILQSFHALLIFPLMNPHTPTFL